MTHRPRSRPRAALAGVAALATTLALAACSADPAQPQPTGTGGVPPAGEAVKIEFWSFITAWDDTFNKVIDDFEAENPNIDVELRSYAFADYVPALQAALQANDDPALFMSATLTRQLAEAGRLVDLKGAMGDEFMGQFLPATLRQAEMNGGVYAAPWGAQMYGLNYNKPLFEKYGWKLPDTWDDMKELSAQIRKDSGLTPVSFGAFGGNVPYDFFLPLIAQVENGTDFAYALDEHTDPNVSWDSEPVIEALTLLESLVEADMFDKSILDISQDQGYAEFYSGRAAMLFSSVGTLGSIKQAAPEFFENDMGISQLPGYREGELRWAGNQAGWTFSVSSAVGEPEQQAAMEFLRFLFEPDRYSALQNEQASLPSTTAGLDTVENEFVKLYAEWLLQGTGSPHIPFGVGTGDAVGNGVRKILGRQGEPAAVAAEIEADVARARKI